MAEFVWRLRVFIQQYRAGPKTRQNGTTSSDLDTITFTFTFQYYHSGVLELRRSLIKKKLVRGDMAYRTAHIA